jgi:hypothetical protein
MDNFESFSRTVLETQKPSFLDSRAVSFSPPYDHRLAENILGVDATPPDDPGKVKRRTKGEVARICFSESSPQRTRSTS